MTEHFMTLLQPAFERVRTDGGFSYIEVPSDMERPLEALRIALQKEKPRCITLWRMKARTTEIGFDLSDLATSQNPVHAAVLSLLTPRVG